MECELAAVRILTFVDFKIFRITSPWKLPMPARYTRFARLLALRDRLADFLTGPRPRTRPARLTAETLEDRLVPTGSTPIYLNNLFFSRPANVTG
jgi:hypothetical protein